MGSVFGLSNTTGGPTPLVITGRTFNFTPNGTFGQFIPAVTSADVVGKGDRGLQILQAEDSVRYRTNLGIAVVTGKPATVEVRVILPDTKISPSTQIPIPANGLVQMPVIQSLGLSNVYNARISLRVVDGDGKISAYRSVIDQITQAPTYIPAQK
ncbi:MAG: PAS domain-containing protein [Acidobacteriota bacterium]|nr:PAS domain-containing protein [Acidobacteriota bacterium]